VRRAVPTLFCLAGLVLQAARADAETWTILRGKLTKGSVTQSLSGSFTGSLIEGDSPGAPDFLGIDDFSLSAGRRTLQPDAPLGFEGLAPDAWLSAPDQIGIVGDAVTSVHLRAGGTRVLGGPGGPAIVTFRFLELRADASHGGFVQSHVPDSDTPLRLNLKGDLYEVERSFWLPPPCPPVPPPLPGGSGSGGSVDVIAYTTSYVAAPYSVAPAPTLEQLGMRAPEGAEITLEGGALRVSSSGDLFVDGTISAAEIPGLTSVTLTTPARITVTGRIVVPGGTIALNGGEVSADGAVLDTNDPSAAPPACQLLTPVLLPKERVIGHFSLVASAARQIQVDVMPGTKRNFILPTRRSLLAVAILGSRTLDASDIDPDTLRLGSGEAEPLGPVEPPGSTIPTDPVFIQPVPVLTFSNRDRFFDLLAFFRSTDAGIAFGDRELCLVARTYEGELLEGCDRIDTGF